jgi:hypothetical protein
MVAEEIRSNYLRSIRSDIGGDNVEGVGYLLRLRATVDTVRRSCHVTVAQVPRNHNKLGTAVVCRTRRRYVDNYVRPSVDL